MTKYLHVTFGSKAVLQNIRNTYSNRTLLMAQDERDALRYQLIELTEHEDTVFAAPTTYTIMEEYGDTQDIRGWMHWTFITLNDMERDNFLRQWHNWTTHDVANRHGWLSTRLLKVANSDDFVFLESWQRREDYFNWTVTNQASIQNLTGNASHYNLRENNYHFAALTN